MQPNTSKSMIRVDVCRATDDADADNAQNNTAHHPSTYPIFYATP